MANVTPTGSPAWVRANGHEQYGGHAEKRNYQGQGAVNPRTDVTAQNYARVCADLAAIQRTASFCTIVFTNNDSSPAIPTVDSYELKMAGNAPTPARNGNGDSQFTWLASYNDAYGVAGSLNIIGAKATVLGSASAFATCVLSDPDANNKNERVRVYVWDDAGAAVSDAQVSLTIWTGS